MILRRAHRASREGTNRLDHDPMGDNFAYQFYEDSRGAKLAFAWRGLVDGLRNRLGPLRGNG
jgi:hypothetical protein